MKKIIGLIAALLIPFQANYSFALLAEQRTGPITSNDGAVNAVRGDKTGAQVVTDGHGRYQEAAVRGALFSLSNVAYTIVAGNASAGALGTILFINGFFNPINSGKNAVILRHKFQTTSGTPGGPLVYNFYCGLNITSAATGTIRGGILSNSAASSSMIPQVAVIIAATPAATPAALVYGPADGPAAIAAGAGLYSGTDETAGSIVVPPGCVFGVAATATGTTQIVGDQLVWEEVAQ